MAPKSRPTPIKGDELRFVKGTWVGYSGWKDLSVKPKKGSEKRAVIVDKDGEEIATDVNKSSIRKPHAAPRTFEEALLQQHKDVETAMVKLAEMFAKCGISNNNNVLTLFSLELTRARDYQMKLGAKARWRHVDFNLAQMSSQEFK